MTTVKIKVLSKQSQRFLVSQYIIGKLHIKSTRNKTYTFKGLRFRINKKYGGRPTTNGVTFERY